MPPSATAINTQRSPSRYGTSGRIAVWVSARTLCATSTPAAPRGGHASCAAALHRAAVCQDLPHGRRLGFKCRRPDREPLAPLTRGAKIDMDEPRARIEGEAEEADLARVRRGHSPPDRSLARLTLERHRVVVRHGDVEGRAVEVPGAIRNAHGAALLGAKLLGASTAHLSFTPQRAARATHRSRWAADLP